jgi:hypothetical protein
MVLDGARTLESQAYGHHFWLATGTIYRRRA